MNTALCYSVLQIQQDGRGSMSTVVSTVLHDEGMEVDCFQTINPYQFNYRLTKSEHFGRTPICMTLLRCDPNNLLILGIINFSLTIRFHGMSSLTGTIRLWTHFYK